VVSGSAGSGVSESVIVLGDSTTANSIAVTKLNENLASDVYTLSTIGTKGTGTNKHEGRSGWRFSTYFSNDADNAFYNPTSQTFDADYYFTNTGTAKPTWFFINLGINDVFGYTSDHTLESGIEECKEYLDAMIESINDASPNTKIGICLTIPPNHSQDAYGKEYKCGQNRDRYKRNNALWVNAVIAEYDNREAEGIYLIPIHAVLDTVYNMGFETLPVNARNTDITYQYPIGNGGVHPVTSGYWQIADQYAAFLKGHASGT
jgi:lysophospholipase L1-like esterase